jgi:SAM-dependent methyltransferase
MPELHPATKGFGLAAEMYERGRPDYPQPAIELLAERLDLRPGRTVVDLAAGTGKLTRLLTPTGADVVAVEPIDEMRAELERRVPAAQALAGTAEAIPLADSSADAVTVAQAFHWFRAAEALAEIRRVLRPGGGFALVWNARDQRDPAQAAISEILEALGRGTPRWKHEGDWGRVVDASGLFTPCETATFDHAQTLDQDGLVERVCSISFVAAAPRDVHGEVEARVRAIARAAGGTVRLSYVTELYLAFVGP